MHWLQIENYDVPIYIYYVKTSINSHPCYYSFILSYRCGIVKKFNRYQCIGQKSFLRYEWKPYV